MIYFGKVNCLFEVNWNSHSMCTFVCHWTSGEQWC